MDRADDRLAVEKRLVDQFLVDGVVDRLTDPHIVEGRFVSIDPQVGHHAHLRCQVGLAGILDLFALVDRTR